MTCLANSLTKRWQNTALFHLETTPQNARDLVGKCRHELVPAKFVQSEEAILSAPAERYTAINALMSDLLSFLVQAKGSQYEPARKEGV
jgi:hypothetical protein